MSLERKLKKK
jgi:hypothetical protein